MAFLTKILLVLPKALISIDFWKAFTDYVRIGGDNKAHQLTDSESLGQFLQTRASHVAQTSLYGYLRTRAGTRYPELFEDPGILLSINMAKWQIWLACLSDLTIYIGGLIHQRTNAKSDDICLVLSPVIDSILKETGIPDEASPEFRDTAESLKQRVANCDFSSIPDDEFAFIKSPEALFYWAPVADQLKNRDKEIVKNSVRFRWHEIRRSARKLLQAETLMGNTKPNFI
ncbi:esterase [Candidatus Spongiihabitans sp.]|uniref:esterase n=1 Tax=Candidatus Spongiihabitans sp. TaxID=3101308 RepID=UPI003C6F8794